MPSELAGSPEGIFLPVTTPFDPVTGDIAPVSFRENLRRWLSQPIDGIVLFGSTGEGVLLSDEEKHRLVGFARDLVPPNVWLLAGVGAESTRASIAQARHVAEAGVDALLVKPPVYFSPLLSAGDIRDYYLAVADASPAPLIIYHIPKFTHVTMEAGLVAELARHENIIGMKDSSGDIKRFADFTNACQGAACRLFVGSGALLYTALELGAAGGILGVAVIAPAECAELLSLFRQGHTRRAGELQGRLGPVHKEIVAQFGAVGVKAALDLVGYTGGPPRAPLRALGEKERAQVARVMREAGLCSPA